MQSVFLNDVLFYNVTAAEFTYYFINCAFLFTVVLSSLLSYGFLRPKFPSWVNCWFCNRNFWVPYESRNCFDCRYCDQYNGFTPEGDYNTNIFLRNNTKSLKKSPVKKSQKEPVNGLCKSCNLNQQLKVQQLSNFTAINDANFDLEVQHFSDQLEKCYKLCKRCSLILNQTLKAQNYDLLAKRLNGQCPDGSPRMPKDNWILFRSRTVCFFGSHFCLILLLLLVGYKLSVEFNLIGEIFKVEDFYAKYVSTCGSVLSLLFLIFDVRLDTRNILRFSSWGLVFGLTWTDNTAFLSLASVFSFLLHAIPSKLVIKKNIIEKIDTPVPENVPLVVKDAIKQVVKEAEAEQATKKPVENPLTETPRMETRSQSVKKNNGKNRSRMFSPPPEVYTKLNNLRLASPEPEPRPSSPPRPKTILQPSKFSFNRTTPSPKKNCFSPSEPLPEMNLCKFPPYVDYDYGPYNPGCYSPLPLGHAEYSCSFTRPMTYPCNFPSGRFSPQFFDSNHSSPMSEVFYKSQSFRNEDKGWVWLKRVSYMSMVVLNIVALILIFGEFFRRIF